MQRTSIRTAFLCGLTALNLFGCGGGTASTGTGGSAAGTGNTTGSGGSTTGSGGSTTGSGGSTTGSGGSTTGSGGSTTGSGGSTTGSGGSTTGSGGTMGGGGTGGTASGGCITQSASLSTKIATVGIVTWSTTQAGVQSAKIDFGLTTAYGMTAPVDLTQPNYRTLLLGMKASRMYHYRITAVGAGGECQSPDFTIMTGPLANGLVKPTVTTTNAAALAGGFIITGQYVQNTGGNGPAYILDNDGDIVWWYNIEDYVTAGVMNYAGTHMWINNHPPNIAEAKTHRVSMDGLMDEDLSSQLPRLSHQLTVLPDETIVFYAGGVAPDNCDDIKERSPNGTVRTIVNSQKAMGTTGPCHVNFITYSKVDDTIVFSDHIHCAVTKVKRSDGTTVWVLNNATKTFTGATWLGSQHGIHILGVDDFLIFNNNSRMIPGSTEPGGTGDGSGALEIKLDLTAKTVTKIWSYKAMGTSYQTDVMGDIQRLANGNIVLAFGGKGVIQEINASGTVLQEMKTTTNFGYIQKRATLYGPPPR